MRLPLVLNSFYRVLAQYLPEAIKPSLRGFYNEINKLVTYGLKKKDIFTALDFEINSNCNLECSYCPTSFSNGRGKHLMSFDTFKNAIDNLSSIKYSGRISPHFFGEPLLDDRLPELMSYARKKLPNAEIVIHTNGIRLSREKYDACMSAGVTGFLVTKHTKTMPKNIVDIMQSKYATYGTIKIRTIESLTLFNRGGTVKPKKERKMKKCFYLSDEISITHTGNVVCTNDFLETHIFGNVNKSGLLEVWNDEDFKRIRNEVRKGIFTLDMCKKCVGIE
ncbi:radical SAM/SPASM domain-containing protein [Raoultella planticola]|uniref:Radical SAM/SPASM domain-containing protein n=2 Tax=Raoultella planticola TaxID=575 RepID=A0ABU5M4H2_RAOPL|nr:radical SAM/SPASM domain-containing protein [Raoultella planticola]MDW4552792.1 radical SAM/SPASM domain-containing protein [Raoultella planticola]MDZ7446251.1 radical SAM/SPASM domain-containing protein [Raoultella planticola]MDZ7467088.1 radical SAM/SPASM domain-containing protein [Raoultella planticola]MDZ7504864.1 radical SAM/SPASM domain-containing protein [Raoultella planticola]MEA5394423.1 radical SAM/SPASM domain-containing protein [Raoultella planticola]